jgi:hypothetical protein
MRIEPSDSGGAFVSLIDTVAVWAAPARNMAIAVAARALASFAALFIGNGSGMDRDMVGC